MVKIIKDYVKAGNYVLIDGNSTVEDAVKKYVAKNIGGVLIADGNNITGIFTEKDLAEKIVAAGKDPKKVKVSEVMTPNPCCIDWNADVDSCMFMMMRNKFRHLPIRDNKGNLYAVASVLDILKAKVEDINQLEESSNMFEKTKLVDRDEDTIASITKEYQAK